MIAFLFLIIVIMIIAIVTLFILFFILLHYVRGYGNRLVEHAEEITRLRNDMVKIKKL